jgi:hypothetical protein
MSIGMDNNILRDLGPLLPLLILFLFDTEPESLVRFLAGERLFPCCLPFFRVPEERCQDNLSRLCKEKALTLPIAPAFLFSIGR